jgi:hypothetical protein
VNDRLSPNVSKELPLLKHYSPEERKFYLFSDGSFMLRIMVLVWLVINCDISPSHLLLLLLLLLLTTIELSLGGSSPYISTDK